MKTAIYIEDGLLQLVITPETKFEKNAIGNFESSGIETKIMTGAFYACQGGWSRHTSGYNDDERSLILTHRTTTDET